MLGLSAPVARLRWGWSGACEVCRAWGRHSVCPGCIDTYAPLRPRCGRCALPLPAPAAACGRCLVDPPPYCQTLCAVDYAFPWDGLIQRFKFEQQVELAAPLADLLVERALQAGATVPDLMAPVPLSDERLQSRGYDQAWALARRIGRRLKVPAHPRVLERRFDHAHQVTLSRRERLANLRGAFRPLPRQRLRLSGAHVALVDDVMTTGATAMHAAMALLDGGARRVDLWVVARTPEPGADR